MGRKNFSVLQPSGHVSLGLLLPVPCTKICVLSTGKQGTLLHTKQSFLSYVNVASIKVCHIVVFGSDICNMMSFVLHAFE
jgi:hypothetical protein